MNKSASLLLFTLFLAFNSFNLQAADTPSTAQTDDAYVLKVAGLACPYCAYGVEKQFNKQDGVTGLDIDIAQGRIVVHVTPDTHFTDAQLKQLVEDAGFELGRIVSRPAEREGQSDAQTLNHALSPPTARP